MKYVAELRRKGCIKIKFYIIMEDSVTSCKLFGCGTCTLDSKIFHEDILREIVSPSINTIF